MLHAPEGGAAPSVVVPDAESCQRDAWTYEELLDALPPLPTPRRSQLRAESCLGIATVLSAITGCVAAVHVGLHLLGSEASWGVVVTGLLVGDPGTVPRSPSTCFPLPAKVADMLRDGESLLDLRENIVEGGR